ncbi:hypothetical protein NHX12_014364 [Muraenolepis orangiensis]|uniref:Uncharacterized protein n=1 Tax=Muraenolepis orangiensis TaxID=630683 RepID=A0A9Q0DBT1_9TELE|nr:hypothetical protein NHX12_014364 [Muraenolepis orangiensis]
MLPAAGLISEAGGGSELRVASDRRHLYPDDKRPQAAITHHPNRPSREDQTSCPELTFLPTTCDHDGSACEWQS